MIYKPLFEDLPDDVKADLLQKWEIDKVEDVKRFIEEYIDQRIFDFDSTTERWNEIRKKIRIRKG